MGCKNKWGRIEALQRLKEWLEAYREAWLEYKTGNHDVEFPYGSYWMITHCNARVAAAPG